MPAQTLLTGQTTTITFTYAYPSSTLCQYLSEAMTHDAYASFTPSGTWGIIQPCVGQLWPTSGDPCSFDSFVNCFNYYYQNEGVSWQAYAGTNLGFYPYRPDLDTVVGSAISFACNDCTPDPQLSPQGVSSIGSVIVPAGTSDVQGYVQSNAEVSITIPAAMWTNTPGDVLTWGGGLPAGVDATQWLIFGTWWLLPEPGQDVELLNAFNFYVGYATVTIIADAICCGQSGHQPPTIPGGPGALGAENGVDLLNVHPAGFYIGSSTIAVAHHSDWLVFETLRPAIGRNIRLSRFPPGGGIDMTWYYPNAQDLDPLGNPTGPYNLFRFRSYDFGQTWVPQPPMQDGYYTPFLPGVKWARNLYLEQVQRYALCYNDTSGQDTYGYPDGTGLIQFVSWDQQGTQYGPFQVCPDTAANGAIGCIEVPYPTRHLRACFQDNSSLMLRHFVSGDDGATWQEWTAINPPIKGGSPALCLNERSGELLILYCSWDGQKPDPPPTNGTSYVRIIDVTGKDLGNFPDDDYGLGPGLTASGTALIWTEDRTDHLLAFGVSGPSGASESGPIPLCQSFDGGRTWNVVSPTS